MTGSLLGRALVQRPSMPPGFTASVEIEGLNALGLEVLLQTRLGLGSTEAYAILDLTLAPIVNVRVRIEIKAPDELAPNYSEIVTFRSCTRGLLAIPGRSCPSFQGFVEIKIKTAPVDISDSFSLECSPPDPSRIRLAGESVSTCTIEATGLYPGSYLQLVDLHSSLEMTSGWSVAFTDMNQSALDVLSVRLHEFDEFSFRVNIVAVACDTHGFEQLFDVGISTVLMLADLEISDETPKTANDMEIGVDTSVNFVRTEITVHPNELEMPYSLHEVTPSETPRVQIEYSVGGCGNWTTTLKMSPFQPTGSTAQGGTVPVVTRVTDADNSLVIDPEQVLFGLPIASGIDPVAGESHSHTFDLEYTVPAGTPVGRYTSTITVTISDAP